MVDVAKTPRLASFERHAGPKGFPLVGVIPQLFRDPLQFLLGTREQYGDVVRFNIGRRETWMISDPEGIEKILMREKRTDTIGMFHTDLQSIFGNGLIVLRGDEWREQRNRVRAVFTKQRLDALEPAFQSVIEEHVARWIDESPLTGAIDAVESMRQLTSEMSVRVLFGARLSPRQQRQTADAVREVTVGMFRHCLLGKFSKIPTRKTRHFNAALGYLRETIAGVIGKSREAGTASDDVLTMMLEASPSYSPQQLRDHLLTLLFASHETTAATLTWASYLLARDPELAKRIHCAPSTPRAGQGGLQRNHQEQEISLLIRETLRLYPPVYALAPSTGNDSIEFGGHVIPPQTQLLISQYVVHRHPLLWRDPESVDLDRHRPENAAGRHRYAYFPFAEGPQMCLGYQLAMREMMSVIGYLVRHARLSMISTDEVHPQPRMVLTPRGSMRIRLSST